MMLDNTVRIETREKRVLNRFAMFFFFFANNLSSAKHFLCRDFDLNNKFNIIKVFYFCNYNFISIENPFELQLAGKKKRKQIFLPCVKIFFLFYVELSFGVLIATSIFARKICENDNG